MKVEQNLVLRRYNRATTQLEHVSYPLMALDTVRADHPSLGTGPRRIYSLRSVRIAEPGVYYKLSPLCCLVPLDITLLSSTCGDVHAVYLTESGLVPCVAVPYSDARQWCRLSDTALFNIFIGAPSFRSAAAAAADINPDALPVPRYDDIYDVSIHRIPAVTAERVIAHA